MRSFADGNVVLTYASVAAPRSGKSPLFIMFTKDFRQNGQMFLLFSTLFQRFRETNTLKISYTFPVALDNRVQYTISKNRKVQQR